MLKLPKMGAQYAICQTLISLFIQCIAFLLPFTKGLKNKPENC